MQRINNPLQWKRITDGESLAFVNTKRRQIRLEVNAPAESVLYYLPTGRGFEKAAPVFLALVNGRDTVEFFTETSCEIICHEGDVAIFTADGQDVAVAVPDAYSFTRLVEPRRRDHQAEMVAYLANYNMERMRDQLRAEFEAKYGDHSRANSSSDGEISASGPVAEPPQPSGEPNAEDGSQPGAADDAAIE